MIDKKIDNKNKAPETSPGHAPGAPASPGLVPETPEPPPVDWEAKAKELEDKYLRTYADFDNYRKRVAKEKEELVQATSERLLRELLEVKDHLELALAHAKDTAKEAPKDTTGIKPLREGIHLTLKQLGVFLEKFGVQELHSLGQKFDPAHHEAVHQEESVEYEPGTVVHEYQKGYLVNGRLLRAARVTVAKEKS